MADRPSHEPRELRHLCRDPARPAPTEGRWGGRRDPAEPQERKGRGNPQAAWSLVPLPAALQPGPQSDRNGVRQAQSPPQTHWRSDNRCPLESDRRYLRPLLRARVLELPQGRRICPRLNARRSKSMAKVGLLIVEPIFETRPVIVLPLVSTLVPPGPSLRSIPPPPRPGVEGRHSPF